MMKFIFGLAVALAFVTPTQAESQLKPFDILWHCDRVTNSVSEMVNEIGNSIRTNGESYTDEAFATNVYTSVMTRESMTIKRLEYERAPGSPFYSALLYERMVNEYKGYVVKQRLDFGTVNSAIVGTYVFRSCINENLSIKINP